MVCVCVSVYACEWYGSVYMCCVCVCVYVSRYMCKHLHKDNRGQFSVITQVHFVCFLLLFFRQDLSLIRKDCLAIRPQARFYRPSPLITSVYHLPWHVQMASGD